MGVSLVAALLALSACGSSGSGQGPDASGGTAAGRATATRTVTITTTGTAAGTTGSATGATTAPAGTEPAACTPGQLGIHYVRSGAAAGTTYETFAFVNVSSTACTLYGYPGVSLVLNSGDADDIHNVRDPSHPPKRVVVAPGARAPFVVGVHGPAAQPCVQAQEFRFIPPNDTAYEQIAHPEQVCGGSIVISAVGYR